MQKIKTKSVWYLSTCCYRLLLKEVLWLDARA